MLKLETLERDLRSYLRLLHLPEHLAEEFPHLVKARGSGGRGTGELEEVFYGRLSAEQVVGLAEYYAVDMELFDYRPDKFSEFASERGKQ